MLRGTGQCVVILIIFANSFPGCVNMWTTSTNTSPAPWWFRTPTTCPQRYDSVPPINCGLPSLLYITQSLLATANIHFLFSGPRLLLWDAGIFSVEAPVPRRRRLEAAHEQMRVHLEHVTEGFIRLIRETSTKHSQLVLSFFFYSTISILHFVNSLIAPCFLVHISDISEQELTPHVSSFFLQKYMNHKLIETFWRHSGQFSYRNPSVDLLKQVKELNVV